MIKTYLYILTLVSPLLSFTQLIEKEQATKYKIQSLKYILEDGLTIRSEFYNEKGQIYLSVDHLAKNEKEHIFFTYTDSSFYQYDSLGNLVTKDVRKYEDRLMLIEENYKYSINEKGQIDSLESFIDEYTTLEVYQYSGELLKSIYTYNDAHIGDSIIKNAEWKSSYHYKSLNDTIKERSLHVYKKGDDMYKLDYIEEKEKYEYENGVLKSIIRSKNKDSNRLKMKIEYKYSNGLIESIEFIPMRGYSKSTVVSSEINYQYR